MSTEDTATHTLEGFLAYARSRDPEDTIDHDQSWNECAVGEYIGDGKTEEQAGFRFDVLETERGKDGRPLERLAVSMCGCENYGQLVKLLERYT